MQNEAADELRIRTEQIVKKLLKYPKLAKQLENIVGTLDVETCGLDSADEAELKILELTRQLGKELLTDWAKEKHEACVEDSIKGEIIKNGKKN